MKSNLSARTVVLSGPMGSGKSTVGLALAQQLSVPFVDLDAVLAAFFGLPIPRIFELYGEPVFRHHEQRLALELLDAVGERVVAWGGGTIVHEDVRIRSRQPDVLWVYLRTSESSARARVGTDSNRPLLHDGWSGWRERFDARRAWYEEAPVHVDTDEQAVGSIVEAILVHG